jgi:hypothetical protein
MAHTAIENQTKISDNSILHYYVGPAPHTKQGILLYNPKSKQVVIRRSYQQLNKNDPILPTLELQVDNILSTNNPNPQSDLPDQPTYDPINFTFHPVISTDAALPVQQDLTNLPHAPSTSMNQIHNSKKFTNPSSGFQNLPPMAVLQNHTQSHSSSNNPVKMLNHQNKLPTPDSVFSPAVRPTDTPELPAFSTAFSKLWSRSFPSFGSPV